MVYKLGNISNERRFAIFGSYGYICQRCFNYSKGNIVLHHIKPVKCGGSDANFNLIPLCSKCHKIVHTRGYRGPLLKLRRK
jgi:5-methylcytosine-specific restriction endonuclease McrA